MYVGMTLPNFNNEWIASVFVDQAAPNIQKYFKEYTPGWQGEFAKILIVAAFVYNGCEEKQKVELIKE